jgi:transcriptional regulator with XRE-family HTH domain
MRRVRELREEAGVSQVRLAVAAGMDPATLNRLEMGKASPNLKTLERLASSQKRKPYPLSSGLKSVAAIPTSR